MTDLHAALAYIRSRIDDIAFDAHYMRPTPRDEPTKVRIEDAAKDIIAALTAMGIK